MILKFATKLANLAGLATIVGACATGLILEHFFDKELQGFSLSDMLSPIEPLIVPIFFVSMSLQAKLEAFNNMKVALLVLALTMVTAVDKPPYRLPRSLAFAVQLAHSHAAPFVLTVSGNAEARSFSGRAELA